MTVEKYQHRQSPCVREQSQQGSGLSSFLVEETDRSSDSREPDNSVCINRTDAVVNDRRLMRNDEILCAKEPHENEACHRRR